MQEDHSKSMKCDCQSLMGYAESVHGRSGGVCAYCDFGKDRVDFAEWRQLTLEHVISDSELTKDRIHKCLRGLFGLKESDWPQPRQWQREERFRGLRLYNSVYRECEVTVCHFCNSLTSRYALREEHRKEFWATFDCPELRRLPDERREQELLRMLRGVVKKVFEDKRQMVTAKMDYLQTQFKRIKKGLTQRRTEEPDWEARLWEPFPQDVWERLRG